MKPTTSLLDLHRAEQSEAFTRDSQKPLIKIEAAIAIQAAWMAVLWFRLRSDMPVNVLALIIGYIGMLLTLVGFCGIRAARITAKKNILLLALPIIVMGVSTCVFVWLFT